MQLSITELKEIVYCIGSMIAEKQEYNHEFRQKLFNKLYTELENQVEHETKSQIPVEQWTWECSEGTLHSANEECDCPDSYYLLTQSKND